MAQPERISWVCPFCSTTSMLASGREADSFSEDASLWSKASKAGSRGLRFRRTICPNPNCRELVLTVSLHQWVTPDRAAYYCGKSFQQWRLLPESSAKVLPEYIPKGIREDYYEACRIVQGSPKAAATLARRCLQGMIRDFWHIKRTNLAAAIRALKKKVQADEFEAIDAVRKVGNIGAHMEKNVNLIVDVEPGESEKLLRLIELLFDEWYVRREKRKATLASVRRIAEDKTAMRKAVAPAEKAGTDSQSSASKVAAGTAPGKSS